MRETSILTYLNARAADPSVRLLADTLSAIRSDPGYLELTSDPAAGAFLDAEAPASVAPDALDRVFARIEAAGDLDRRAAAAPTDRRRDEVARLPSPLREAALEALSRDHWRFASPGFSRLPLALGGAHCELMRIEPGRGAAPHDHAADEITLVVTGAYDDGHAAYGPGDISLAKPGFAHAPVARPGEVCFVLAVTDGPARFKGVIGLLQRLTGFPWTPQPAVAA